MSKSHSMGFSFEINLENLDSSNKVDLYFVCIFVGDFSPAKLHPK